MRKKLFLIGVATGVAGLFVFGFAGGNTEPSADLKQVCDTATTAVTCELWGTKTSAKKEVENRNFPPYYSVRSTYGRGVSLERLQRAEKLSEVIPGYPVHWIKDYKTVEILAVNGDDQTKVSGEGNELTEDQRNLLASSSLGTVVNVSVVYRAKNSATGVIEEQELKSAVTVIPDAEATYIEGDEALLTYLKNNSLEQVVSLPYSDPARIRFTVAANGAVTNVKVKSSFGDEDIDKLLSGLIENMGPWYPAQLSDGSYVPQNFELFVGSDGC